MNVSNDGFFSLTLKEKKQETHNDLATEIIPLFLDVHTV